jgi:curved DNA-binding protein CbpA
MSLFRELAKQVHPDVNGGSVDANKMMQEVLANRNNENALRDLARRWGLRLDGSFDDAAFDAKSASERTERVFEAVVGAIVRYSFRYKRRLVGIRGVITGIRTIQKGKMAGAKEYTIYNFSDAKIWRHKSYNTPNFDVVGLAHPDDLRIGQNRVQSIKEIKKENDKHRQNRANVAFVNLGLVRNKNYEFNNYKVYISGYGWRNLVRTTNRCVYFKTFYDSREKRASINKVEEVSKREVQ